MLYTFHNFFLAIFDKQYPKFLLHIRRKSLCESQEQVSQKIYEKLQQMTLVPILVYGERAIFDKKRFDDENNMG